MPQQVRFTTQNTVAYVANGRQREKLDRGMVYRELYLKLTATVAVAGGGTTTAAANIQPGDIWGVVRNINLLLNSNDSIRNISGEQLAWLNFFQYSTPPRATTNIIGITATNSAIVESWLVLPLWMPNSVKPIDTALDARLLSDFSIEITWGDETDIGSGTGFGFDVDPVLEVFGLQSFGVNGPFNTMRIFDIVNTGIAQNSQYRVDLPVGNMYRAFLINAKDGNGDDDPDLIGNVKLVSGPTVFCDMDYDTVRNAMFQRTGMREVLAAGGGSVLPYFLSSGSDLDAWTYLDLVTDGLVTEAIDTLGFSELKLEFDVLGTISALHVMPIEVIPLRSQG